MAHGITDQDNLFLTHKPGWHGLGHVFEDFPSREEAQAIAHPWEPITEDIYSTDLNTDEMGNLYQGYNAVEGYKMTRRSDTGKVLGVVSDKYQVVSNNELWDIAEALEGSDPDVQYETGGSLMGGAKVWLLLKLKDPLVVPGDPNGATIPYYSLQNSHDGLGSLRGQATMTRIVCANTAQAADIDSKARGTEFVFRHSKNVGQRIEQAKEALVAWKAGLTHLQERYEHLLSLPVDSKGVADFRDQLLGRPPSGMASERVWNNFERDSATWTEILEGPTCEALEGTAYGLVQATIEYAEHHRKAKASNRMTAAESRFKRHYLERSAMTRDAVRLAELVAA